VFTGQSHGPRRGSIPDVLQDYAQELFKGAGLTDVKTSDSRYYHNGCGDLHCGTNPYTSVIFATLSRGNS